MSPNGARNMWVAGVVGTMLGLTAMYLPAVLGREAEALASVAALTVVTSAPTAILGAIMGGA